MRPEAEVPMTLMQDIENAIKAVTIAGSEVWTAGAASASDIGVAEQALSTEFPPSYRRFLAAYGALSVGDSCVSGVLQEGPLTDEGGNVYFDTLSLRRDFGLPYELIVVCVHEDGAYCLDTSRRQADGECPIVNFERHSIQHEKPVAPNFENWLIDFKLAR